MGKNKQVVCKKWLVLFAGPWTGKLFAICRPKTGKLFAICRTGIYRLRLEQICVLGHKRAIKQILAVSK